MDEKYADQLLAPIAPWLDDPDVTGIMADGHERVYVERRSLPGKFEDVLSPFQDDEQLLQMMRDVLAPLGKTLDAAAPYADVRLPDGSRLHAVVPPISLAGPSLTVRKFSIVPLSVEDVIRFGSWTRDMVAFLRAAVRARLNILIAGGAMSGKTTVANLLAGMADPDDRIVTVEPVDELRLPEHLKYVVRMESRPPDMEGRGAVTMRDLVWNALRMRPDRIVVSDLMEGDAVLELVDAMNRGHEGNLLTMHANGAHDALARLEMMVTSTNPTIPLLNIRHKIAAALDVITYQERMKDGRRRMVAVAEVAGMRGDAILLQDIFMLQPDDGPEGKGAGHFTGHVPGFIDRLRMTGVDLPEGLCK
ncbi:MAG: CpaF family protein [Anaerolineae bacterium]|nr:CpaF family protein [Anaerolineae bacterium]